ncbi:MAG: ATP-dependent Clp protease proteolytic subunit, partial [Patescibacteria group bacterium]
IKLFIDSTGGELSGYRTLANGIKMSKAPITGIVISKAYSAAALLLQCCHRRIAMPHSRIFFHKLQETLTTNIKDASLNVIEETINILFQRKKEAQEDQKEVDNIVIQKSGLTLEQLESIENQHLTPEKAKELNLIDEIGIEI